MKKINIAKIIIPLIIFTPDLSIAASAKCSAKAADVYYNKLLIGDRDFILYGLRSGTGGKLSPVEISTINNLIYSCEKGIENQSYNTKSLWEYNYNEAKKALITDSTARAFASAHVEMYEYGKSIR